MSIDTKVNVPLQPSAHLHIVGICGTGMSAFARILLDAGYRVSGSDLRADPPTGPALQAWGIDIHLGYDAGALQSRPDVVVIGNAVTSDNAVAALALERGIPCTHMPACLHQLLGDRHRRIVIAGTHGKSTTSAVMAWVLQEAGLQPGWLIGATPHFGPSGKYAPGPFVLEGDEYNAAYFDKGAKFLHYKPDLLGLTTVEFDHADLYPDLAAIETAFRQLLAGLPQGGAVVLAEDTVRFAPDVPAHADTLRLDALGFEVIASDRDGVRFQVAGHSLAFPLPGRHAAVDAAIAALLCERAGAGWAVIAAALPRYPGLKLRQEVLLEAPVRLIRDFGHHPTEIAVTLKGLREAWPDARIVAVFEPRSYTSRTDRMRDLYQKAFVDADRAFLAPVFNADKLKTVALDTVALAKAIGDKATAGASFDAIAEAVSNEVQGGLVVLFSNGTMNGLPERLVQEFQSR